MAQSTPVNPDLPSSILLPGVYLKLNLQGGGAGLNSPSKKLLLIGNKTASGTAAQDTVVQVTNQTDANNYCGQGSDLARLYAAAISQVGAGAVDTYLIPLVAPSAGTAATHLIVIAGPATTAGSISATICGYSAATAIANGDTATIIASNLATQINGYKDLPVTAVASTGTITLTYNVKGLVGNDLPRSVNIVGATGVTASPGTLLYASNATSTASITVSVGGTTVSYTVTSADTPTVTGAGVAAALNAGGYPVTATASTGTVSLFYVNDRIVHRITASMLTVATQTVAISCGTLGAGAPTLTSALTNLQPLSQFPVWVSTLNDGGGVVSKFHAGSSGAGCSIGTIKTHIATYADGYNQKGQRMFWGSTEALATAGDYQTSTGVQTTSDSAEARFVEIWQVDSAQQAYELAGRCAALHIAQDYMPKNYAGFSLRTSGTVPLLGPHRAVRSGTADQNSALLTYYMTPVVYDDVANSHKILRDRTTDPTSDQRLWSWGAIATLDYIRSDLNSFLSGLFSGKSFKASGQSPKTPNTITTNSIREAIAERLRSYDSIDFVDDIDNLVKGVTANQDGIVVNRVNVFVPLRIPVPLYQLSGGINLS